MNKKNKKYGVNAVRDIFSLLARLAWKRKIQICFKDIFINVKKYSSYLHRVKMCYISNFVISARRNFLIIGWILSKVRFFLYLGAATCGANFTFDNPGENDIYMSSHSKNIIDSSTNTNKSKEYRISFKLFFANPEK